MTVTRGPEAAESLPHRDNLAGEWGEPLTTIGAPRTRGHTWVGMNVSLGLHAIALATLVLLPLYLAPGMPEPADAVRVLIFNPPRAAAPPLPRGVLPVRNLHPHTPESSEPRARTSAMEVPTVLAEAAPSEQTRALDALQVGDPDGSDFGVPEGIREGVDGGIVGGVPGGQPGGLPWGDGDIPVRSPDRGPRLLRQVLPVYPLEAFVQKIAGTVVLEIVIGSDGAVRSAKVVESIPQLDEAAKQCVRQWKFEPARKHGRPVASLAHAPISFRLY